MDTSNPLESTAPVLVKRYRWTVLAVLWLTLLVSYFDRVSIAATLPFMSTQLGLSTTMVGVVTGALFLSYTMVQVPAGALGERFGQRRLIAAAIAWWTLFSVLTGAVAGSLVALISVRFLMGAGEGMHPPPLWRCMSNWFGHGKRTTPMALMLTALTLGPALAPVICLPIISSMGWHWVFYLTAIPGVITVLVVLMLLRDTPNEKNLTTKNVSTAARTHTPKTSWRVPHIYLMTAAFFFFGFVLYALMGWLPTYLIKYRGLHLEKAGLLSSAPYIAGTVGLIVGAYVCERWFNQRRRQFVTVGYLITAVFITGTVMMPSATLADASLIVSGFFLFTGLGPFWSLPMDVVRPHEVGQWLGFINMGTQISGFFGPIFIGWLIGATGSFNWAFVAMIGSLVLAAVCLSLVRTPQSAAAAAPAPAALRVPS